MHRTPRVLAFAVALALAGIARPAAQAPAGLPTPESVIGWAPCADNKLATYEQIADYFQKLDAATDRMQLIEIGKTAEGRTQLMAIVSSEANMKQLARYKDIARRLALARGLTDAEARALAKDGKAVVWVDFGLHSTEVAHGQTAPLFAWKVVTDETDEMRAIRDSVILLLVPNMNPDGTTLVANWYRKTVGGPFSRSEPPALYHKYIGHDNNRDWFMFNMPETQNVGRQLYQEWFPQIIHNQHQTGAFPARITIPPYEDPPNPNIPPLVIRGITEVGAAMGRRFEREGKAGVVARLQYDTWWNGGMRSAPYYHNMIGILTEAQHNTPDPITYDARTFPKTFADGTSTSEPTTFYPNPFRGGEWHLRNTCEYMVTASMAVLDLGAKRREEWLYDIYQMGRDAIRAGERETFVISAEQWDPGAAVKMLTALRWGGIDIERATAPFTAGAAGYPAGSWIVRGAQPFRPHLVDLLTAQVYPDRRMYPGGPPEKPYDITGWTLPYQMGVKVDRIAEAVTAPTEPVTWPTRGASTIEGRARAAYVLDPRANDAFIAVNRLLKAGESVSRASGPITAGGTSLPPGAWVVSVGPQTHLRVEQAARDLGLHVAALDAAPAGGSTRVTMPRVGLYNAWGGNMDEGWTRWLFEQYELPFTTVRDQDLRAGKLRDRFDVLVLPDASFEEMLNGLAPGTMPAEFTGGMGPAGSSNIFQFVSAGGTLVAMDAATELPIQVLGLPIRNVTAHQRESDLYVPGSILRLRVDPADPVAYGMPQDSAAFFAHSQAFAVGRARTRFEQMTGEAPPPPASVRVAARYADRDLLMSGWMLGERLIAGQAAVITADLDKGRVVLLGFRTQHRGQPQGTYKLLFNAMYLGAGAASSRTEPTQ